MAHKDIRFSIGVGGRHYEAVGFLDEGESSVDGDEMFRRVPDAIGDEDWEFLDLRRNQIWSTGVSGRFCLATNRRDHFKGDLVVACFERGAEMWLRNFSPLKGQWGVYDLVIRRVA